MSGYASDEEDQYVRDVQAASTAIQELYLVAYMLRTKVEEHHGHGGYEELDALKEKGLARVREIARRLEALKSTRAPHLARLTTAFRKQEFKFERSCGKLTKLDRKAGRTANGESLKRSSRLRDAEAALQEMENLLAGDGYTPGEISDEKDGLGTFVKKKQKDALEVVVMRPQVLYRSPPGLLDSVSTTHMLVGACGVLFFSYAVAKVMLAAKP